MLLPVYDRPPVTLARGEGCQVWDTEGRRYLDFTSGIGVNALGHAHPRIVATVAQAAGEGIHVSNLFHHRWQEPLAVELARWSGLDYAFFTSTGTEANEVALKTARAYGLARDRRKLEIVAVEGSFHGRTMGALSITGQAKYRGPFRPLVPGVRFVPRGDAGALEAACSASTAAIFVEVVQGEGGVHEVGEDFLRAAAGLSRRHDALLVADEIQCGLGRTGARFGYQRFDGLTPDVVTVAKPLAAGIPLAATLLNARAASAIQRGWHGTTFGGGPLACRVGLEVLEMIEEMLPEMGRTGAYFGRCLRETFGGDEDVAEVRQVGLMAALELRCGAAGVVERARRDGLLVIPSGRNAIRLLPPYIATRAEIDTAVAILAEAIVTARVAA